MAYGDGMGSEIGGAMSVGLGAVFVGMQAAEHSRDLGRMQGWVAHMQTRAEAAERRAATLEAALADARRRLAAQGKRIKDLEEEFEELESDLVDG